MSTAVMDYTLSNTHVGGIVRPIDSFQRPPFMAQAWAMATNIAEPSEETYLLTVESGRVSSLSATTRTMVASSTREAIDLSLEVERQNLTRKLVENASDPALSFDVDAISETVDNCYELLSRWGSGALDMSRLLSAGNPIHLAAVLRVTADAEQASSSWQELLGYTVELSRRVGVEPADALYGLM